MRDLKAGDLLIRQGDNRPVLVVEVKQSPRHKYGTKSVQRKLYRLLDEGREAERWITDTEIIVKYELPHS